MNRLLSHLGPPLRAVRAVFGNRAIRRMELAFLLFNIAEPAMWIAILVYAFDQGGTPAVGFVSILLLIPAGLLAPLAAALGDRFPRERVVRFGYLAQALTTAALALALVADAPPAVVYLVAAISTVSYTTGRPNHHALLPSLGRSPEEVAAANSVSSLVEGVGATLGGLAAAVLANVGTAAVMAVAAAAAGLGVLLTLGVHTATAKQPDDVAAFRPWSLATDAFHGLATLWRAAGPRMLVAIALALAVGIGAVGVLMVPLAIETLDLGDPGVGLLSTVLSVGLFVGAGVSVAFATRRRLALPLIGSAVWLAVGAATLGLADAVALATVGAIVFGAGITLMDVVGRTMLQRATDDEVLTRVFGAVEAMWLLGYAAGAAVAPPLASITSLPAAFAICGVAVFAVAAVSLPALRRVDAESVVPERQLALLATLPMFAPLPRLDLERIARQLDLIATPVGTDVIRQGDVGDRFYIVDAGEFEILRDGVRIDTAREGGFFGEIALLEDVPRTATVRALTDGAVWALDQEEFLATVTGLPQAASAAHAISAERRRTFAD